MLLAGLARGARIRPQVDPGVRDGEPARPDHRDGRRRWQRHDAGRAGHAVRARHVQGLAVHGRRRHRPRHRHPRHPQAGLARSSAADRLLVIAVAATASMAALPPFLGLRRQGGRLRNRAAQPGAGRGGTVSCSQASCSARCSPPSTACASWSARSGAKGGRSPAPGSPKCTAREVTFLIAARHSGRGRPAVRAVADPARRRAGQLCGHGARR